MKINNVSMAPGDFVESIVAAVKMGEGFFRNRFKIDYSFNNDIVIQDKDLESELKNKQLQHEIQLMISELKNILELLDIVLNDNPGINDFDRKIFEKIISLINILCGEENGDIRWLSKDINKELLKLERLLKEFQIQNIHIVEQLLDIWRIIRKKLEELRFPKAVLGCYCQSTGVIKLFYQTIKKASFNLEINEVAVNVTVHELFHAAHFDEMKRIDSKAELRGELSRIRREAVIETLAESACLEYSKTFQNNMVVDFVRKKANAHPFPYWGYAGALILENHNRQHGYQDALFKGVYHASLLNTNKAYSLIFS